MSIAWKGRRLFHHTGHRIEPEKWEDIKRNKNGDPVLDSEGNQIKIQRVKRGCDEQMDINTDLNALEAKVKTKFKHTDHATEDITIQSLKDFLKGKQRPRSFWEVYDLFIESESVIQSWKSGTRMRWDVIKNHLQHFEKEKHYKLEFDSLKAQFYVKLIAFYTSRNYKNSYISKNLKLLKWFLKWATQNGYNRELYYSTFRFKDRGSSIRLNRANKLFLSLQDLEKLMTLQLTSPTLERVLDVFLFSCFSGLRYSDIYHLKKSDIWDDTIHVTTLKTGDPIAIPLNDYSRSVLKKYEASPFAAALPVLSNQKMNFYLKDIAKLAGFHDPITVIHYTGAERIEKTVEKWELLTFHSGRRAFVTIAYYLGMEPSVIMSFTGHSSRDILEIYNRIQEDQKRKEMELFNEKVFMRIVKN